MLPPLLLLPWAWGVLAGSPPLPRASVTLRLLQIDIFHNASSTDMVGTALLGDLETHSLDCSPCQIRFLQPWDPLVTQGSLGCELHPNGTSRGFDDAGVNGEDFVSFDADAGSWLTWRGDKLALYARDLLNRDKGPASKIQFLLRTWVKRPVAVVFARAPPPAGTPAPLLLVCRVTGFYPRPVRVAWLQDGEEVGPGGAAELQRDPAQRGPDLPAAQLPGRGAGRRAQLRLPGGAQQPGGPEPADPLGAQQGLGPRPGRGHRPGGCGRGRGSVEEQTQGLPGR
ncbi:unnamed protein product [Eretmochelys imbricata]